tara:strand:+ start:800 stop:1486 length:687 start_codon:yes stop_codon:yes gene_type:complete
MNNIKEKISAMYDGELNSSEIDELIEIVNGNKDMQKQLSLYSLINVAVNQGSSKLKPKIISKHAFMNIFSNVWLSNGLTAAATVLLTLTFINYSDLSRFNENIDSTNKISSAINSKEAQLIAQRSEEFLTDHVMKVLNDPNYMNPSNLIDLRNVGFNFNTDDGYSYIKGKERFQLRIENKDFGLKKVRYWKYGNKIIYLVPLENGKVVTLYGNISLSSALEIAKSLDK